MENKLKVEYVDIDTIKPYKNNAKPPTIVSTPKMSIKTLLILY